MPTQVAVIIATRGRPELIPLSLRQLETQTVSPARVLYSTVEKGDVGTPPASSLAVEYLYGPPGLTTQRNTALQLLKDGIDVVIFFDDDFVPSRFWVERAASIFERNSDVAAVTGKVLQDGVCTAGIQWNEGLQVVESADQAANSVNAPVLEQCTSAYGCNMAFRSSAIAGLRFDERLVLYGWLEDRDFSVRLGKKGKIVSADVLWGVHLGLKGGRVSGVRLGFSQIVNAWYLFQKGTLSRTEALRRIFQALAANSAKYLLPEKYIDRRGRLKGNLLGLIEIVRFRKACRPEQAARL
jgi:glycosyltransferase involved in cell wall biosynthesis